MFQFRLFREYRQGSLKMARAQWALTCSGDTRERSLQVRVANATLKEKLVPQMQSTDLTSDIHGQPCEFCQNLTPDDWTFCPHCGRPQRFPNVTIAERRDEIAELDSRHQRLLEEEPDERRRAALTAFEDCVATSSKAVMCCSVEKMMPIVTRHIDIYATYYDLLDLRLSRASPSDQVNWKTVRPKAEIDLLQSEKHKEKLHYAALTLDDRGLDHYGNCTIFLREDMIAHCASLFPENTAIFFHRHPGAPPKGFRCTWRDRSKLCVVKCSDRISQDTTPPQFPEILLAIGKSAIEDDFVEVQVFGPITVRTFQKVELRADVTQDPTHEVYVRVFREFLEQHEIPFELK